MEYKDYYKIMGLSRNATPEEVKQAYRKLARKYHPDVSEEKDAEQKFKEVNEAYEVLKDPEKRRAYDHLGAQWKAGDNFRAPPNWQQEFHFNHDFSQLNFSDFFENLFGGGAARNSSQQPRSSAAPAQTKVLITLQEAYHGTTRALQMQDRNSQTRTLNVKIPAGVTAGQTIRLSGQNMPEEVYLEVELLPHRYFRAEGKDIYLHLPLIPSEIVLGCTVSVPTLGGHVELKIPPNSQQGQHLRLKGRGFPGKPPGDQYIILEIAVPSHYTEREKALYRQLAELNTFNPREDLNI